MPELTIVSRSGAAHVMAARVGTSLMEAIRDGGFEDEVLAICGGCCACATCHVYVDQAFVQRFPPIGDDENELLDGLVSRTASSRLSCQLSVTESLEGARFTIAPPA